MEIVNKETGERKTIECEGSKEALVLLKFAAKVKKYSNPSWRIVEVRTDSFTVFGYIKQHKPWMPIELETGEAEQ
jgi:hypothetical protein